MTSIEGECDAVVALSWHLAGLEKVVRTARAQWRAACDERDLCRTALAEAREKANAGLSRQERIDKWRRTHFPAAMKRRAEILALREQGLTYRELGERYGVTGNRASQLVGQARQDVKEWKAS